MKRPIWTLANIDVSDDLMHWSLFNTGALTSTVVEFLDTNAVSKSRRFYQIYGD